MLELARRQQKDLVFLVFRNECSASMRDTFGEEDDEDKGVWCLSRCKLTLQHKLHHTLRLCVTRSVRRMSRIKVCVVNLTATCTATYCNTHCNSIQHALPLCVTPLVRSMRRIKECVATLTATHTATHCNTYCNTHYNAHYNIRCLYA